MLTIFETLDSIEKNHPNLVQAAEMLKQATIKHPALHHLLDMCYNPVKALHDCIGEGFPETFNKDMSEPVGLSASSLDKEARRLYIFCKDTVMVDVEAIKSKWDILLTSIHHTEADVLTFAKDKALGELFPFLDKLYKK